MDASAPLNRNTVTSSPGLEMPLASAATSASRIAVSARPKRLAAMVIVIQGQIAARPKQKEENPHWESNGGGNIGPATPTPPPVTLCQASAICVTIVAKPSVVIAK